MIFKKIKFSIMRTAFCCNLILLFVLTSNLHSQDDSKHLNESGICLSIVPHYFLTRTVKFEFDKQLGAKPNWLVLSLLHSNRNDDSFWRFRFDQMITNGGSLSYRYYFFSDDEPKWLYAQSGVVYNRTKVNYIGDRWSTYDYNGMEAIHLEYKEGFDIVQQYGVDFKAGCILKCNQYIFFDFYFGLGIRRSKVNLSSDLERIDYQGGMISPTYDGVLPVLGVRFGVNL